MPPVKFNPKKAPSSMETIVIDLADSSGNESDSGEVEEVVICQNKSTPRATRRTHGGTCEQAAWKDKLLSVVPRAASYEELVKVC